MIGKAHGNITRMQRVTLRRVGGSISTNHPIPTTQTNWHHTYKPIISQHIVTSLTSHLPLQNLNTHPKTSLHSHNTTQSIIAFSPTHHRPYITSQNLSLPNLQNILLNHPPHIYHPKLTTATKTSPLTLTTQLNQLQHFWQHITIPYRPKNLSSLNPQNLLTYNSIKNNNTPTTQTNWHHTYKPIISRHTLHHLPYTSHTKFTTQTPRTSTTHSQTYN